MNPPTFIRSTLLFLPAIVLLAAVSIVNGQTVSSQSPQEDVATVAKVPANNAANANSPLFTDYRGVKIGMTADEVRGKLNRLHKGDHQDFMAFSDQESAQIYYDDDGKVKAISIDYLGDKSEAPSPDSVLGALIQAKDDGSMYQLKRYPEAGYWVSYNRTAGDKPIVTITIQKM